MIRVELVYAEPRHSIARFFTLAAGSMVQDALRLAALDPDFSRVLAQNSPLGIFGRPVREDQILADGDRIEIYRPLMLEPKLARRVRVSKSGRS
jgi:putative ubiquitin-RnfH superfamily antitoxin RatB of RatAB toxin-antitoxin module